MVVMTMSSSSRRRRRSSSSSYYFVLLYVREDDRAPIAVTSSWWGAKTLQPYPALPCPTQSLTHCSILVWHVQSLRLLIIRQCSFEVDA